MPCNKCHTQHDASDLHTGWCPATRVTHSMMLLTSSQVMSTGSLFQHYFHCIASHSRKHSRMQHPKAVMMQNVVSSSCITLSLPFPQSPSGHRQAEFQDPSAEHNHPDICCTAPRSSHFQTRRCPSGWRAGSMLVVEHRPQNPAERNHISWQNCQSIAKCINLNQPQCQDFAIEN